MSASIAGRSAASDKFRWPWLNKRRHIDVVRLVTLLMLLLPAVITAWQYAAGELGARPAKAVYLEAGLWTVRFLLLSLLVTPARYLLDWPRVVVVRRMVGVAALAYGLLHLMIYTASEHGDVLFVASEIVSRLYLTIGFVALLGLVALGATSFDSSVQRLGKAWRKLHRLVFPVAVLGVLHFYMQSKADVAEAVVMSGLFVWLVLWRELPAERRTAWWALLALAPVVGGLTAGLEIAWYAAATRIPASRVVDGLLTVPDGWDVVEPPYWVAMAAIGAALMSVIVRAVWRALERRAARVAAQAPSTIEMVESVQLMRNSRSGA